jgi:plasmid stabilization system protein ParE
MDFKSEYTLEFSTEYYLDLDSAMEYALSVDNPKYAYKLWDETNDKTDSIHENPFKYPLYHQVEAIAAMGFRRAVVCNHLLFYHIDEDKKVITIDSLIHERRDITVAFRHLQGNVDDV